MEDMNLMEGEEGKEEGEVEYSTEIQPGNPLKSQDHEGENIDTSRFLSRALKESLKKRNLKKSGLNRSNTIALINDDELRRAVESTLKGKMETIWEEFLKVDVSSPNLESDYHN